MTPQADSNADAIGSAKTVRAYATVALLTLQEFTIIVVAAYLTSALYHEAAWGETPSFWLYLPTSLFLALVVELIGFGHYRNSQ
jgi:hypothetical protein